MKVISFISAGLYLPNRYRYGDEEAETHLFPYAVTKIFKPQSLLIVLTPKAEKARASFKQDEEATAERGFNRSANEFLTLFYDDDEPWIQ
jgi:CRISPR-associated (Cas) DxTHG family